MNSVPAVIVPLSIVHIDVLPACQSTHNTALPKTHLTQIPRDCPSSLSKHPQHHFAQNTLDTDTTSLCFQPVKHPPYHFAQNTLDTDTTSSSSLSLSVSLSLSLSLSSSSLLLRTLSQQCSCQQNARINWQSNQQPVVITPNWKTTRPGEKTVIGNYYLLA